MADHPTITMKRQKNVNMNRALNCTREMAEKHLDELAEELIAAGIFNRHEKIASGVWTGDIDVSRYDAFFVYFVCKQTFCLFIYFYFEIAICLNV